jgi:thiamine-phosphate pyrophosphorylase
MMFEKGLFRIIDANFNRSREGLRVCEDITRFILNSAGLAKRLKVARHRITDILKEFSIPSKALSEARDSKGDVGRDAFPGIPSKRQSPSDIFVANMERVKESLRVLEEFSKLFDEGASARFAALRYEVYDIEKDASEKLPSLRCDRQRGRRQKISAND